MPTTNSIDLGNGCVVTIASLTFDQVEEMLTAGPQSEDPKEQRKAAWREVMLSITNVPGQESHTRQSVVEFLNRHFTTLKAVEKFSELRLAVLELSGYEIKKKPEPTPINQAA
jgi:hypothetical protein